MNAILRGARGPQGGSPSSTASLDAMDAALIDALHEGFPLCDRPFAEVGQRLGLAEDHVIERLGALLSTGVLTRFGPLYQIERAGGAYLLAGLEVPEARFDDVAAQVNAHLQVAHNYRREHRLNMWFVVAADSQAGIDACLAAIEAQTGLRVHRFPKEREYRVELRLPASRAAAARSADVKFGSGRPERRGREGSAEDAEGAEGSGRNASPESFAFSAASARPLRTDGRTCPPEMNAALERELIAATQGGLPLVPRPYEALGAMLGISAQEVRERLGAMLQRGLIRRIGAVPNHYRLGYVANGMSVWDVDDARIDALGERIGRMPGVTHCYRRTRQPPDWPYNLFVMLHGSSRDEVQQQADTLAAVLGDACRAHDILYSTRLLKKTGLRLATP